MHKAARVRPSSTASDEDRPPETTAIRYHRRSTADFRQYHIVAFAAFQHALFNRVGDVRLPVQLRPDGRSLPERQVDHGQS